MPSGLKASAVTAESCASQRATSRPVGISQKRIVRSRPPVANYDLNKNGILEPNEIALIEKDAALMAKFDKNNDGKIDEGERSAMQDTLKKPDGLSKKKKK